jgi:hypothetical protein
MAVSLGADLLKQLAVTRNVEPVAHVPLPNGGTIAVLDFIVGPDNRGITSPETRPA